MPEPGLPPLAQSIASFADRLAEKDAYPESGAVAALVAALAASLAAAAADRSRAQWDEAGGARAQAQALERLTTQLADRDAAAYAVARQALAQGGAGSESGDAPEDQEARDWHLAVAVEQAAGPPLELSARAADIAELARGVAGHGAGEVRTDAVVAALLAAAASRAAARLVEVNLVVGGDQRPAALARGYARAAEAAAASAEAADA
jgi:methenyltetrahydrofolate cyclohydrolase